MKTLFNRCALQYDPGYPYSGHDPLPVPHEDGALHDKDSDPQDAMEDDDDDFELEDDDYEDYRDHDDHDDWDDYGRSGEKYGWYNGFSDDVIDDAFEGDPELTWNVD